MYLIALLSSDPFPCLLKPRPRFKPSRHFSMPMPFLLTVILYKLPFFFKPKTTQSSPQELIFAQKIMIPRQMTQPQASWLQPMRILRLDGLA